MLYKDRLSNGIRVVTEELTFVHSVSIGIWVGTGSKYETPKNNGISHFLEHMFFKGTNNRTAKQIAESLEMVGGHLNAFTSKEYTCYYAKVLNDHFDLATDVLTDMLQNSLFREDDIEKERNVILEEIKMYDDAPDELVHELYTKTVWQDDPLGKSIIGTMNSVSQITRDEIISYFQSFYVPENIVIAIVGNIKHEKVMERLEQLCGKLRGTKPPIDISTPKFANEKAFAFKDIEQMHLCLGFPGIANLDKDIYALSILNHVFGGGLSSRLFQEIRENKGLSYTIYSYHSGYSNTGLFGVYAGTSKESVQEVVEIILSQINALNRQGITNEELENAKQNIKGTMLLSMESINNRMNRIGRSEICYNRIITPEEVLSSVFKITIEDILKIANRIFQLNKLALATVGPKEPDFDFVQLQLED